MKPSHLIIFSVLFIITIITSGVALVTSGIALSQSNKGDATMACAAGKTAFAAFNLVGSKIAIPAFISRMWQ